MSGIWFSPRQAEVSLMVVSGESPRHIASTLGISVNTVNQHVEKAADRIRRFHPDMHARAARNVIRRYYVRIAAVDPFTTNGSDHGPGTDD